MDLSRFILCFTLLVGIHSTVIRNSFHTHSPCLIDEFDCGGGECIRAAYICDGDHDCGNGIDELNCGEDEERICTPTNFRCNVTGRCIFQNLVCDGVNNCEHGEDESMCDSNCVKRNCDKCTHSREGGNCTCPGGFELSADGTTCVDVDECLTDDCLKCVNRIGNFQCTCGNGYTNFGNRCSRLRNYHLTFAISTNTGFESITPSNVTRRTQMMSQMYYSSAMKVSGCAFSDDGSLLCTAYNDSVAVVYFYKSYTGVSILMKNGLVKPEDIAVDTLQNNIYVTDASRNVIIVCTYNGTFCTNIETKSDSIKAISLDTLAGYMYWTDVGTKPSIHVAGMDGSDAQVFINDRIVNPNSLVVDDKQRELFWVDLVINKIERVTLNTKHREILYQNPNFKPISVAIDDHYVYWTQMNTTTIYATNRRTKEFKIEKNSSVDKIVTKLSLKSLVNISYRRKKFNPCDLATCSHICLIRPHVSFVCSCPDGMKLHNDQSTCVGDLTFAVVNQTFKMVYVGALGSLLSDIKPILPSDVTVVDIAYDPIRQKLFTVDWDRKGISVLYLNSLKRKFKRIIYAPTYSINKLYYEPFSDALYWTDNNGLISVASSNGSSVYTLLNNMYFSHEIAFYPEIGKMYVSIYGDNPQIKMMSMSGEHLDTLVENVGNPVALYLSSSDESLYFVDNNKGALNVVDLTETFPGRIKTLKVNIGRVNSMFVNRNYAYWTDENSQFLSSSSLATENGLNKVLIPTGEERTTVRNLLHLQMHNITSVCSINNGGCVNLCLLSHNSKRCNCFPSSEDDKDPCHN